jgi:uncharacterized membrane protein YphA (DoxX/SURF4 family)
MGLLLMRLVIGSVLLVRAGSPLWGNPPVQVTLTSASLATAGLLLIAGLWTPVAGTVVVVVEIVQILRVAEQPLVSLLAGAMAAGLAMVGPGRWSVDARLFGWRRIDAPMHRK